MDERLAIGLDLGGTDLKSGLVSVDGALQHFSKRPSRAVASENAPLECMREALRELEGRGSRAGFVVGIGTPGAIHPLSGCLVGKTPHMPHWDAFPVRERASEVLGCPVIVDNDANCAALAEHVAGAARGAQVSITVTVGTGVGAGIVVDGRVFRGAWGGAGELGHLPIGSGNDVCRCGSKDCAEPEMSGSGLARAAGVPAHEVFVRAANGDAEAQGIIDRLARQLGRSIACAVDIVNPGIVVLGGAILNEGEALLQQVHESLLLHAMPSHTRDLQVTLAKLGERAGVVGAGLLALRQGAMT